MIDNAMNVIHAHIMTIAMILMSCIVAQLMKWHQDYKEKQRQKQLWQSCWDQIIISNDGRSILDKFGKPTSPPPPDKKIKWLPDYVYEEKEEEVLYNENDLVKPITR